MRRIDAWFLKYPFYGARQQEADVRISMDGRGRCLDNIFIERLWRSLTYEALSLRELAEGFEAPTHHRPMDRLLHRRAAALGARRENAGRGLPRRPACGYAGHAAPRQCPQTATHRHDDQGPRNQAAYDQSSEYTFNQPPTYPTNRGHLTRRSLASRWLCGRRHPM